GGRRRGAVVQARGGISRDQPFALRGMRLSVERGAAGVDRRGAAGRGEKPAAAPAGTFRRGGALSGGARGAAGQSVRGAVCLLAGGAGGDGHGRERAGGDPPLAVAEPVCGPVPGCDRLSANGGGPAGEISRSEAVGKPGDEYAVAPAIAATGDAT